LLKSFGVGKTTSGVEGGTASWRSRRGKDVDGEEGKRVIIGVGEDVESDNGNNEASPSGTRRMISAEASSVSYISAIYHKRAE
jgi:hypothetical protein